MKKLFILLNILYHLAYVLGQLTENPCSAYFSYEYSEKYGTMGRVAFTSVPPGEHEVRVKFSQKPSGERVVNNYTVLLNDDPVSFRVQFHTRGVLPRVIFISMDDEELCRSNKYPPPSTTYEVQHTVSNSDYKFPTTPRDSVNYLSEKFKLMSEMDLLKPKCGREGNIEEKEIPRLVPLILGGNDITPGQFPWLAAIMHENPSGDWVFRCGGTLISVTLVLTAAHCLVNSNRELANVRVELGRHNIHLAHEDNQVYIPTAKTLLNPDYLKHTLPDADIGLVVLSQYVQFTSRVHPIAFVPGTVDWDREAGNTGVVVGWGLDESGQGSNVPKMISVPIVSELECRKTNPLFFYLLTERTLCAGRLDGTGPSHGDSGSALMVKLGDTWVLRGIVSVGVSQGNARNTYVVYCNVQKFREWIYQEIFKNQNII